MGVQASAIGAVAEDGALVDAASSGVGFDGAVASSEG
jgi:hypothetical protein